MLWELFQDIRVVLRRGSCATNIRRNDSLTGFVRRTGSRTLPTESGGLQDDPLDNAGADAERPGNLEDAVTFGPQFPYRRLDRRLDPTPPNFVRLALARASPALTRSRMIPRSNSANTPSI